MTDTDTESASEGGDAPPIRRLSSLLLGAPARASSPRKAPPNPVNPTSTKESRANDEEIIPDSEEERKRLRKLSKKKAATCNPAGSSSKGTRVGGDVIEISSSEDDSPSRGRDQSDPFLVHKSGKPAEDAQKSRPGSTKAARTIIISDSEPGDESDDNTNAVVNPKSTSARGLGRKLLNPTTPTVLIPEDEDASDDGAILMLNEPRINRKPIQRPGASLLDLDSPRGGTSRLIPSTPGGGQILVSDRSPLQTPVIARVSSSPAIPSPSPPPPRVPKAKSVSGVSVSSTATPTKKGRISKKALAQADLERRQQYAEHLFDELNKIVFGGKLPDTTELTWNNRLQTTAGRAKWHKSREGVETSSIELATKVLDCEARIRNTLSHEMCHLACWMINADPKENHGPKFKSWADKIMRKRPDIQVTTKHSYEIEYKFKWQCEKCAKIYGRHSKSIDPSKCMCGVCKEGELIPLFATRTPKTKTKADSRMAAAVTRDSPAPSSAPRLARAAVGTPVDFASTGSPGMSTISRGASDDVDNLVKEMIYIELTDDD
ncbi:hypothetical protein BD410DRAFT_252665 [Rickenella mellea]|uniref:SprT-like domain-containing protein n=1 Tax=Rickenella mellea TaxID=50990 RepID=A0A4Y7QPV2_9AGAM|nr:hypothetical protein BD410DRAFT_252665 [Rickenella mellea]